MAAVRKQLSTGEWQQLWSMKLPNRSAYLTADSSDSTLQLSTPKSVLFLFLCPPNLERRIYHFSSEIRLHSQTNSRGWSHYQGSRPGATALQSLQCEGWQFQDGSDVRQENMCTLCLLIHSACLQYKSPALNNFSRRKEMVLLGVSDTGRAVLYGPMESKGNLVYKFVNAEANVPIMMQNLENPVPKVVISIFH